MPLKNQKKNHENPSKMDLKKNPEKAKNFE